MLPTKRRDKGLDQQFKNSEKLYKRVPREHLTPEGEIEPSLIQCSFNKGVKSAPSVLRSKYGTPRDALRRECANGKDVSNQAVFKANVGALPKRIVSGDGRSFDFYPFHDPDEHCYAHTVLGCRLAGDAAGSYTMPSNAVKNAFKAQLVSALTRATVLPFPVSLIGDLRKLYAAYRAPKAISASDER